MTRLYIRSLYLPKGGDVVGRSVTRLYIRSLYLPKGGDVVGRSVTISTPYKVSVPT